MVLLSEREREMTSIKRMCILVPIQRWKTCQSVHLTRSLRRLLELSLSGRLSVSMLENQDVEREVIFILTISVSFITLLCFPRTRVAVLVSCSFVTNVSHD